MDIKPLRKYPVGIQTFSRLQKEGYIYVDKTDLIWNMAHTSPYIFLSRPRRFGKSLLSSTLASYFRGERELFKGLKIMELEKEWQQYPVIHIDLSIVKGKSSAEDLSRAITLMLSRTDLFREQPEEKTPGEQLEGMIRRAYKQTGQQVVVIIDEYDAPLLEVLHIDEELPAYRKVMQEFYQPLKACEAMIRFCFITGITRLSQMNIFSTLNNLRNISLLPQYSAICGITEEELFTTLLPDIEQLAASYDCNVEEIKMKLKTQYDGYHFANKSPDIYNPYSLFNSFVNLQISNYWFETGTPTFLIQMMRKFKYDITLMDDIESTDYAINRPTEAMTTIVPLLYQSGYLTIKNYDRESEIYTLSIPNQEVRIGYADGLLPTYVGLEGENVQAGFALKFWRALKKNDLELALHEMQAYLAGIPYVEGFKKKLAEAATAEGFYEYTLYLIFSMLNVYVRTQIKCRGGRIDMVVLMPDTTYVFELKTTGTAAEALAQIEAKDYAIHYQTEGRKVMKTGIRFNVDTRTVEEWAIG